MGFEKGPRVRNFNQPEFNGRKLDQSSAAFNAAAEKIEWFLRSHERYVPIDELVDLRDKWVAQGAITVEEANKLPGIKQSAERAFVKVLHQDAVHHAGFNTQDYAKVRDKWIAAGIVTAEEANCFPLIREIAKDDLFDAASAVNVLADTVQALKTNWVEVGIITEAEADELIAEGKRERERYLRSPGGA